MIDECLRGWSVSFFICCILENKKVGKFLPTLWGYCLGLREFYCVGVEAKWFKNWLGKSKKKNKNKLKY